jgi:hypothetical protein
LILAIFLSPRALGSGVSPLDTNEGNARTF